ncbi:uncharacterized protein BO95DRAFT_50052 [Aspergillus brunneoviolaceus CBS 621.78]|uniref:Uncharacterized protein n=1 Tax=Aspergillus brunneoviolaceus CBS 621.78 TaxID=1450534 RepID=A0ACD1GGX0_9EURO|nr:hypothetical protein BO95DRAFT_50052 [Aspergillus brunneoviolaceus CBS 621.78]RAH48486.1 hypothetical protein BO95DRAFT_50052 [Aspergillus brunneoviolaceus CBS 621.78]
MRCSTGVDRCLEAEPYDVVVVVSWCCSCCSFFSFLSFITPCSYLFLVNILSWCPLVVNQQHTSDPYSRSDLQDLLEFSMRSLEETALETCFNHELALAGIAPALATHNTKSFSHPSG